MSQRALPFQYAEESTSTGMTSLSGLPAYVDMAEVSGLVESVRTHMIVREGGQGWTDAQMVMSLILLNIAGGECVDDLRVLEKDEGLGRVLRSAETHRMRRGERRAHQRRWRKQRQRSVASPSAVFRYLGEFHDASEEDRRRPHKSVHTGAQRCVARTRQGKRRHGGLRPPSDATHSGNPGHGRHPDRDPQD